MCGGLDPVYHIGSEVVGSRKKVKLMPSVISGKQELL